MGTESKVALKAGVWYVFSTVMVKAVSTITTPIFTRLMTTGEYGVVSTFTSWYNLLLTFCTMNLTYSIGRAKIDFPEKLDNYIGSMQLLSSVVTTIFVMVCLFFIDPLSTLMSLDKTKLLLLLIYLFFTPAINFVQTGYRFRYKYKENIGIAAFISLGSVFVSLILMLFFEGDMDTLRITGMVLPTVVLSIFFWIISIKGGNVVYNGVFWKYGLRLSTPLILHTVSITALSQTDRIFIANICGSSKAGLYSLASNYTVLLSIVTNAVAEGWLPWFHDTYHLGKYDEIRKNVKYIVILGCFVGLGCVSIGPEAVMLLGGESYREAIQCIPPLVMAVVCRFIYTHYVNIEMHLKRTVFVSVGTVFAAILNILLNVVFIPVYGYTAACYTTLASYITLMIIHFCITRIVLKIKLYNEKFMFGSFLITCVVAALIAITYDYLYIRICLVLCGLAAFIYVFRQYGIEAIRTIKERKK